MSLHLRNFPTSHCMWHPLRVHKANFLETRISFFPFVVQFYLNKAYSILKGHTVQKSRRKVMDRKSLVLVLVLVQAHVRKPVKKYNTLYIEQSPWLTAWRQAWLFVETLAPVGRWTCCHPHVAYATFTLFLASFAPQRSWATSKSLYIRFHRFG